MNSEEIISAQQKRIEDLEAVVQRAIEDVNWMVKRGRVLNRLEFDYLDKALEDGF